jgi:hypothetical protein
MKKLSISGFFSGFNKQSQTLFWINGRSIFVVAGKKRKTHRFITNNGFKDGRIADFSKSLKTIQGICQENSLKIGNPLVKNKAIVFIPTDSSPLEQSIFKKLFRRVGFFDIELRKYETAFHAFLAKQAYEKGVFAYIGQEISEIGVFSNQLQQSFIIYYSLKEAIEETSYFFREQHLFELSADVALDLYQEMGRQGEKFSLVVRGRNSRNQELQTSTFSFKDVEPLFSFLQKKAMKEIDSVIQNNSFKMINPDRWIILGDDFFKNCLDSSKEKSLKLKSEFDLMQGVEWL